MRNKKVFVFGIDCFEPTLVFDEWRNELPNISSLMNGGIYGKMESTLPPITVPAWTSMMTSKDPGQLGFYGFRNRKSYDYEELYFANGAYIKEKTIYQILSRNRLSSIVLSVPQSYPPKPLNGIMVGCFLTPDKKGVWTYPEEIGNEIDEICDGDYIIDVKDFRTENKSDLLKQIYLMTERRFKAVRRWVKTKEWDFFIFVEMGVDRIHHAFWRYHDKNHRLYEKGHQFEFSIKDYYKYLDKEIGSVLNILDENTTIMLVSDHGAQTMVGAICVNEYFRKEGLLTLKDEPTGQKKFQTKDVDWLKTTCWGEGGYYARIFMNVEGREPQGIIPKKDYEKVRDEIKERLENLGDENDNSIGTKVFKPEEVYRDVKNIPPDLIVYFGNLNWRSAGSVGGGKIHTFENDTGPDDANHAQYGLFIINNSETKSEKRDDISIYDVTPTILKQFGIEKEDGMIGKIIE